MTSTSSFNMALWLFSVLVWLVDLADLRERTPPNAGRMSLACHQLEDCWWLHEVQIIGTQPL